MRGSPCEQASTVTGDTLSLFLPVCLPQILYRPDWDSHTSHVVNRTLSMSIQYRHRGLAISPIDKLASDTLACQGGKRTDRTDEQHTPAHAYATVQPMHNDEAWPEHRQDPRPSGQNKLVPLVAGREPRARERRRRRPSRTVMLLGVEGFGGWGGGEWEGADAPLCMRAGVCMVQLTMSPSMDPALQL